MDPPPRNASPRRRIATCSSPHAAPPIRCWSNSVTRLRCDPARRKVCEELAQRIAAAGLAGQLDVARSIAEHASPQQLARPEITLSLAYVDFYKGDYEASRERCETLLDKVPADRDPHMRALVINQLGVIDFREQKFAEAGANFDKALDLLKLVNDPKAKAAAYTGRGGVDVLAGRLDAATAEMGQARLLHEMSNDAYGMARVDLNLGAIAMYRGQPQVAIPLFEQTAARFEVLSVPEARDSALRSLSAAYAMLLEHDKSLAATERLAQEDVQSPNTRERWWNVLCRAIALEGVGRLDEANVLLQRIKTDSDAEADAAVRSEADAARADIAFERGDYSEAEKISLGGTDTRSGKRERRRLFRGLVHPDSRHAEPARHRRGGCGNVAPEAMGREVSDTTAAPSTCDCWKPSKT